jgi:sterol desaturase/sphingolipid hydroxylase (fatty acid hydroxylase superfamily)
MSAFVLANEAALRLAAFIGLLALMIGWERLMPRRPGDGRVSARWLANLSLVGVDTLVLRFGFPIAAVGAAVLAADRGWGLFNSADTPGWVAVVVSLLVLDLAVWAQHRAMHAVPWLWRLHRVHHSDVAIDATTGVRFHPVEIALSMLYKMAVVIALGVPAAAVVVFEIVLNTMSLFSHANVRLAPKADRVLRRLIVTPDMHRVHHSVHRDETDSNFGFNLSVWDRLFGTYKAQPRDGHRGMTIGLDVFREPCDGRLDKLLVQPLRGV